ncbi:uncharacterized protein LOC128237945 [Mya arenaria]|uniref:uncharacterized protein LOC128237945 n=1 Tax=Mya arenaria TaxID=6604 RepID=UPI0022E7C16A|nr:uncharacterized protein LOC128237945 [Mya arenaria]
MHLSIICPRGGGGGGHTRHFRQKTIPDRREFDTPNNSGSRVLDIRRILHLGTRSCIDNRISYPGTRSLDNCTVALKKWRTNFHTFHPSQLKRCVNGWIASQKISQPYLKGVELPPSDVLQRAHTDGSTDAALLSKECTLPVGEVNIWLEHLNNVAANRERGQAKAAETRSLKKKELRTETTPGGAATSTATTHRSSARSPNHSQAQSAPDNIMVDVSRFGRRRVPKRFDEYIM